MNVFTLTKWYLDCVAADGSTAIAYWTEILWQRLSLTWHSLAIYPRDGHPIERSSARFVPAPSRTGDSIRWHSDQLSCQITCRPSAPPFEQRLLDDVTGLVDWRCEAPAGTVVVDCDGMEVVHGLGYAERLVLTRPPWQLPITILRWGRWIPEAGTGSIVWIDWLGTSPLTAVFADGQADGAASVTDDRIATAGGSLLLQERRTLRSRSLADTLGPLHPVLAPVLPQSWLAVEDRKWLSRGTRRSTGAPDRQGWAVHETVRFPP